MLISAACSDRRLAERPELVEGPVESEPYVLLSTGSSTSSECTGRLWLHSADRAPYSAFRIPNSAIPTSHFAHFPSTLFKEATRRNYSRNPEFWCVFFTQDRCMTPHPHTLPIFTPLSCRETRPLAGTVSSGLWAALPSACARPHAPSGPPRAEADAVHAHALTRPACPELVEGSLSKRALSRREREPTRQNYGRPGRLPENYDRLPLTLSIRPTKPSRDSLDAPVSDHPSPSGRVRVWRVSQKTSSAFLGALVMGDRRAVGVCPKGAQEDSPGPARADARAQPWVRVSYSICPVGA